MKYFPLLWAGLGRRKARTVLTLLSVLVAFLLFGLLDTVRSTFANFGYSSAGYTRLVTIAKAPPGAPLPIGLYSRIQELPGVAGAGYGAVIMGTFQDPKNAVPIEAHSDNYYEVYPELQVTADDRLAMRRHRTGALVGAGLLKKYHWKVGDRIPLQTAVDRKDGSNTWTFDVIGTFHFSDPGMKVWEDQIFINWDYFNESRASDGDTVQWYSVKVASPTDVDRVAKAIDGVFANSGHETKTQSENAFSAAMIGEWGDLGLIATSVMVAVFFTLLLLTGHTMTQAVRERIPELAVLKTLGFTSPRIVGLVLIESVLLLLCGSAVGLAMATLAVSALRSLPPDTLPIPILAVGGTLWIRGIMLALIVALAVGALPARRGLRIQIVDALTGR